MKDNINNFKTTGKLLSHPHILCSKCQGKTTMFGTNLEGRIAKFGSLEDLLTRFICKGCRNEGKPEREPKFKKVKKNGKVKIEKDENKVYDIPKINLNSPHEFVNLVKDKDNAWKHLQVCWRPDLYLNWDRSCNGCNLYENCRAACKRMVNDSGRKVKAPITAPVKTKRKK